jgi:hypothetical protein
MWVRFVSSQSRERARFEEWLTSSGPNFIEVRNLLLSFLLALFRHGQRGAETYPSGSRTVE